MKIKEDCGSNCSVIHRILTSKNVKLYDMKIKLNFSLPSDKPLPYTEKTDGLSFSKNWRKGWNYLEKFDIEF